MKITDRNRLLFSIVFFLVITGLIGVIIFHAPDPQSDVIVSNQRPDSFDPVKSTQFNPTPFETASPASTATEIFTATDTATATPIPSDQWTLLIQDPLGDPISAGAIAFGSESMSFTSGRIIVPATAPRVLNVQVSAEGYAPGEFTVNPNASPIVLDYLCDFSILVEDERGNPAPNTTIRVWKSNPPQRPIGDQTGTYIRDKTGYTSTGNSFRLKRSEGECRVTWVSKPNHWHEAIGSSRGEVYPQMRDLVMALGSCAWQAGYAPQYIHQQRIPPAGEIYPLTARGSCRLRIWDTLCLAEATDSKQINFFGMPQVLEILRENQRQYYDQYFPKCPEEQPPLYEEKSNDKGEWRLRGVPPALYYVQAIGGQNRYSETLTLYPACGGARLRLLGKGGLWVYVEKEGIPAKDKRFARVPDAEIILQSKTGIKVYAKKSDYEGEARFENLPYGEYRLLVKVQGQTVEKNITIKKGMDTCLVTLPHEEFYTITGIVLEQDSGAPVAGYALELNTDNRSGSFGYRVYQEVISDTEGRFEFHDVLPGKYCVSEDVKTLGEFQYIFSEPSIGYGTFLESYTHLSNINLNVYEDIQDLKIRVKPVVKTNFSGIVVDSKGIPAMNAVFMVDVRMNKGPKGTSMGNARLHPENFKTDASGLFSLTMFNDYRSEGRPYGYDITAMTGAMAPSRWLPSTDRPGRYDFVKEQFHASSIGSVTVEGDMGDTFKDLRIVLEPQVTDKTLLGKLVAEGEDQFSLVGINATQKNQDIFVQLNEKGYFKAENISTGDLTFVINPGIRASINTPNGPHEYYKYMNRTVTIRIEEGHPQTYVEIPLQRSGYYWGYIKDSAGNPLSEVWVWAEEKPSPGHSFVTTDQNGFFFIGALGLVEGKRYNIKYDAGEQAKVMPGVPLNTGNLLLQLQ